MIGQSVILPATHIGGPRHMKQLYHAAMVLVTRFGSPSFFITMKAKNNWPEIQEALEPSQTAEDWPDLVTRVFILKLKELLVNLTKHHCLGQCLSYVYTIEFYC